MEKSIDLYLDALLSFVPRDTDEVRERGDYVTLIHVPREGAERVYSIDLGEGSTALTRVQYLETVWEFLERGDSCYPSVDLLKSGISPDHPVFEYLNEDQFSECESFSDGCPGMDYFLLMWRKGDLSGTAECWDPLGRRAPGWMSVVEAIEALTNQFEAKAKSMELVKSLI